MMQSTNGFIKPSTKATTEFAGAAVSRSDELLSCAKTALKIEHQKLRNEEQHDHPLLTWTGDMLHLHARAAPAAISGLLEDGCTLLRGMQFGLKKLQGLVRRRGHTNDPTEQIAQLTRQLEQDAKELTSFIEGVQKMGIRNKQSQRHWQLVATWFQQVAANYGSQMKEILKLRGTVLAEQAQRRKLVVSQQNKHQNGMNGSNGQSQVGNGMATPASKSRARRPLVGANAATTPLFDSPLFNAPPPRAGDRANGVHKTTNSFKPPPPPSKNLQNGHAGTANGPPPTTTPSSSYYGSSASGGYGGAASGGYGGYGGSISSSGSGGNQYGIRQRRGGGSNSNVGGRHPSNGGNESQAVQMQIQERQQRRQTAQRLAEAQQAEQQLGELGQLFGKMSTLISEQGEVLEKIEDDVESALVDVEAGQEQLAILHNIKKGNRGLIIKVFLLLNFLICFMKLYQKKK